MFVPEFAWSLDPKLAGTLPVGDFAVSRLLLTNDVNYPWLVLVPRRPAVVELIDLQANEQTQLLAEVDATARALKAITGCDKLNIAMLGNQVSQFPVHVIARFRDDAAWPLPVWGAVPPLPYQAAERDRLVSSLRQRLDIAPDTGH
jgi:diadenosine tetraphosphate (Ap4A) HIT family hydrolase